jgi:nucleoside-diphosphate-sugar epimerase
MIDSTILEDVEKIRNVLRRDDFEDKRVLVAGGAGFVGSWICDVFAIKGLANSDSPITFHPLPSDDPKRRCPDINKARKLLGWKPKIGLGDGLWRTTTWFKSNRVR